MIKQLTAIFASHLDVQRKVSEKFNELGHVVIVQGEELAGALGVKEVFGGKELKYRN